jgi:hypothetical protein
MPVTEIGLIPLQPYNRVEERGYAVFLKSNLTETGDHVFGMPTFPSTPATPASHLFTEVGWLVFAGAVMTGVDETGQRIVNTTDWSNPKFSTLNETGQHVIMPFQPFVDYFRSSVGTSAPSGGISGIPSTAVSGSPGWEIVLYPEDKDDDTIQPTPLAKNAGS